ncbi:MAG: hypothetical protein KGM44_07535, partial [bacterium]|nr:hypothetical protein [bacterium]
PTEGASSTIALTVPAKDAGGYVVNSGTYNNPITIADSDSTHTSLALNGAPGKPSVISLQPSDALLVNYDGKNFPGATFTASASGVAAQSVTNATLTPIGALGANPASLSFTATGASAALSVQVSQPNYSGTVTVDPSTCGRTVSLANASGASPLTLTVTPNSPVSNCHLVAAGGNGQSLPIPVTITTTSIAIQ